MGLFRSRPVSLFAAAALAVAVCEVLTAGRSAADVYMTARASLSGLLAGIAGTPERAPRALALNGAPVAFTPYHSAAPVEALGQEWLSTLAAASHPATARNDTPFEAALTEAANLLIAPKVSQLGGDFAAVMQFFDGDGEAARDYILAARNGVDAAPRPPMPGVTVTLRRIGDGTDIAMSRFEDVPTMLAAFDAPADAKRLPLSLQPPARAELLADIGDKGTGHLSRTVVARGPIAPAGWMRMRSDMMARDGFELDPAFVVDGETQAFRARRGSIEADVFYTPAGEAGRFVEVIEIREPLVAEGTP